MPIPLRAAALLCCLAAGVHTQGKDRVTQRDRDRDQDTGTNPSLRIERMVRSYVVNPDGSYQLTVDEVRGIALERAVAAHSQYAIPYNGTLDRLAELAAYTQKADGRRVPVSADQIKDQQEPASGDAPTFQDTRLRVVVFPDVALGDRLVLHYVLKRATALFPGQFEDLASPPFYRHREYLLHYDLPDNMRLYADAVGFEALPAAAAPGRRAYRWRYQPGENRRIEAESVSYLDYGKRLAVSTFADYAGFARAFDARAADKADITPAIAALARQVTAGVDDARGRALLLSEWVRRNIRYVGVYVGPGGVVPHPAGAVLARRYGDCKDHAMLLAALLAAAGIDSSAALINSGNAYRLPRAPTLGIFDHMVTYVPALQLFLDPTADTVAAGYLPYQLLGKPALLVRSGQLLRTPARQRERHKNAIVFQVGSGGGARFRVVKTAGGALAEPYRHAVRNTQPAERDQLVGRMLRHIGLRGYGVFDAGTLDGRGDEYQMAFAGISDSFANLPGQVGIGTAYSFWGGLPEALATFTREPDRTQDFVCQPVEHEDETAFEFAPGLRIVTLPEGVALRDARLEYNADYRRSGNAVTVRRRVRFRPIGGNVCSPADFRRLRPLLERIARDLKSQIVVHGD